MFSSQNWLFSMGQERRLREGLIEKSDVNLDTVVTLPSGAVSASNIATAIASVSHGRSSGFIHMIDVKSESRTEGFATLLERYRPAILNLNEIQKNSRLIPLEEIREADYVLLPQRIFRTIEMSSVNLVSLGEICISIRPPTPYRGQDGITVIELGIPNLRDGEWNPIVRNDPRTEKWNTANPMTRNESFLASNDILLSVKGTLGLARLVSDKYGASESGDQSEKIRAVVSTSCIALRLSKQTQRSVISPQYLLMYLRSSEGQEQIRSLQVGTGMPHISNQTLMNAFRIPIPSLKDQADVVEEFEMLCKLEFKIQAIKQKMEQMIESRWIVKLA